LPSALRCAGNVKTTLKAPAELFPKGMILFRTLMGDEGKPVQKYQSKFNPEESSVGRERERERGKEVLPSGIHCPSTNLKPSQHFFLKQRRNDFKSMIKAYA